MHGLDIALGEARGPAHDSRAHPRVARRRRGRGADGERARALHHDLRHKGDHAVRVAGRGRGEVFHRVKQPGVLGQAAVVLVERLGRRAERLGLRLLHRDGRAALPVAGRGSPIFPLDAEQLVVLLQILAPDPQHGVARELVGLYYRAQQLVYPLGHVGVASLLHLPALLAPLLAFLDALLDGFVEVLLALDALRCGPLAERLLGSIEHAALNRVPPVLEHRLDVGKRLDVVPGHARVVALSQPLGEDWRGREVGRVAPARERSLHFLAVVGHDVGRRHHAGVDVLAVRVRQLRVGRVLLGLSGLRDVPRRLVGLAPRAVLPPALVENARVFGFRLVVIQPCVHG